MKILLIEFKKKKKIPEAYSTLPAFLDRYPAFKNCAIEYYITRLKQPFENDTIKITRIEVLKREK